ncbi:carboxypeptidase-like regulatory domain-containing protein [Galbitalea sp. SE-J8]|uniref:carboxypeptidase-like regulatory domain-containing protein n=1 Tax=Galbitalea sp. SE-J8 TaxID=3054952 RepID=UPI00259D23C3|nr:carboxypeptidase-like regulatory domain-containing protein [Galbitalea sp. SE-J8]MDM4763757.1 carboxypeptidase-like regulatory domain-containing protein [Galbitalea sp. SE-J8]
MKKFAAVIVALALATGGALATAMSASPAGLVTLKGHVRTSDGAGTAGIVVGAGVPYDGAPSSKYREVKTDANGRYELHIAAGSKLTMSFEDPRDRYFGVAKGPFAASAGSTHRVDRTLERSAMLAGTVVDSDGDAVDQVTVKAYDAETGETYHSVVTTGSGHFHLTVPAGDYKLRFAPKSGTAFWYGHASTRANSPTVTVGAGKKTAGLDQRVG